MTSTFLFYIKESRKHFIERSDDYIPYFKGIPFDVNILVYTEDEIKVMLKEGNQFIKEILADSMEIYA